MLSDLVGSTWVQEIVAERKNAQQSVATEFGRAVRRLRSVSLFALGAGLLSVVPAACDSCHDFTCDIGLTLDRTNISLPPGGADTVIAFVQGGRDSESLFVERVSNEEVFVSVFTLAHGTLRGTTGGRVGLTVQPRTRQLPATLPHVEIVTVVAEGRISGSRRSATLSVNIVKGFSVSAPDTIPVNAGTPATATITISRHPRQPPVPIAFAFGPPPELLVTGPAPAAGSSATVTVRVLPGIIGTFPLIMTATDGVITEQDTIVVDVRAAPIPPDFSLTVGAKALTAVAGTSVTTPVTIDRTGGHASPVQLAVLGLPNGVTPTFTPNPATGTSTTLTLDVGSSTMLGPHNITLRGTSGGTTGSPNRDVPMTLQVDPAPALALTAQPSSISLAQGATGTVTLNIQRTSVSGAVTLSAAANPGGLGLAFAPSVAGGTTPLDITVPANSPPGPYTVQMQAALGALTATASVAVTVTASLDFTLSVAPALLTAKLLSTTGQSGNVQIVRAPGFGAPVSFAVTGLPTGVSATFTPGSTTGPSSVVQVTARGYAMPGTYPGAVRGTSGTLVRTTPLTVVVADSNPGASELYLDAEPTVTVPVGSAAGSVALFALIRHPLTPNTPTFNLSGLPTGVTAMITQAPFSSGVRGNIKFVAAVGTLPGTYPVMLSTSPIAATNGTVTISVVVTPPP
jgi:hypothetical protein